MKINHDFLLQASEVCVLYPIFPMYICQDYLMNLLSIVKGWPIIRYIVFM